MATSLTTSMPWTRWYICPPPDVLLGILPFFHSFGYTITLWAVVTLNIRGVYHSG